MAVSLSARAAQRRLALIMVLAPVIGVVAAIVAMWGWGVGPVELSLLAVTYVLGVMGVEIGLHRYFSHRAFKAHPVVAGALAVLGSMAAQGPVLFWAAVHRRHHAHSDQPGDPHSPHLDGEGITGLLRGIWHAHIGWLFAGEVTDMGTFAPDLLRDRFVFRLSRWYPLWLVLGLAIPAAVGGALTGTWKGALLAFLWGGMVRTFLVHHATWSVNSLCHLFGSREFETRDRSTNNLWLMPASLGGSWHNNHHAYPTGATTSFHWWQLDPCGWVIACLERTGLVWDVKHPLRRLQGKRSAQAQRVAPGDRHASPDEG